MLLEDNLVTLLPEGLGLLLILCSLHLTSFQDALQWITSMNTTTNLDTSISARSIRKPSPGSVLWMKL